MYTKKRIMKLLICTCLTGILFTYPVFSALANPDENRYRFQIPIESLANNPETLSISNLSEEDYKDLPVLTENKELADLFLEWSQDTILYETRPLPQETGKIWIVFKPESKQWLVIGVNIASTNIQLSLQDEFGKHLMVHSLKSINTSLAETIADSPTETLDIAGQSLFLATLVEDNEQPTDEKTADEEVTNEVPQKETADDTTEVITSENESTSSAKGQIASRPGRDLDPTAATLYGYKKAEQVSDTDDIFQINVDISGQPKTVTTTENMPVDIVLALDLSGSMGSGLFSRWAYLEQASKSIIDIFLASPDTTTMDINIGIVGYSSFKDVAGGSRAHKNLHALSKDASSLKGIFDLSFDGSKSDPANLRNSRVGGYPLGTGTNSQAGFIGAHEMLAARSEADRKARQSIIIYLTDGMSERYYTRTPSTGGSYDETESENFQPALTEANSIKAKGATIYTVALLASSETSPPQKARDLLENAASTPSKYVVAKDVKLKEAFQEIGRDIKETSWTIDHSSVTLTDPMSEYVTYQATGYDGQPTKMEVSMDYGSTWEPLPTEGWNLKVSQETPTTLTAEITDYHSDYRYRLSYFVEVKNSAHGKMFHKDQTSGKNPETGIAGVIANGYTYLSSDLVEEQEILVPTVYVPLREEASITSYKWAEPTGPDVISPALGYWNIHVLFSAEKVDENNNKIPVTNVTLIDTLSEYVQYAAEFDNWIPLIGERTLKGTTNWEKVSEVQPVFNENFTIITWNLGVYHDDDYDYRLTYPIQVRDEYKGLKFHKDQTSGTNPEDGTDGLVANGRTWLTYYLEDTYKEYDILVPTVFRDKFVNFFFKKIYTDKTGDKPLAKARFELQQCTNPHHHTHTDKSTCWGPVSTKESGADGIVYFPVLKEGEYLLKEVASPFGFELPYGYWIVSIRDNDDITFKGYASEGTLPPAIKKDEQGKFYIPNFPIWGLPLSGQKGILSILLIGLTLVIGGLVTYKQKNILRRKTYDKENH